jgi:hypothetical protein
MKRLCLYLIIFAFLAAGAPMAVLAQELRIYGDEYRESECALDVQVGDMIDIWLWACPGDNGLRCVELSTEVSLSDYSYMAFALELNPDVLDLYMGGFPGTDFSACFNSCQTDWVWFAKNTLYILNDIGSDQFIAVEPWTGESYPEILNCSYEEEPALYNYYYWINTIWTYEFFWCMCRSAEIDRVDVEDFNHITIHPDCPTKLETMASVDNYSLYEKDNPENTIPIVEITYENDHPHIICYYYTFTLGEALMPGTTYTLRIDYIDGSKVDDRDGAEVDFDCTIIATLLQEFKAELKGGGVELSWSMSSIDDEVEFAVSRRSSGGEWIALTSDAIEHADLSYMYLDDSVEPDESYIYRVEYDTGGSMVLLFQTEVVETPAMPLALEQNVPNPFNPVTEIRYYLPEAVDVRLEVYDISGRRVVALADGRQPKGWQSVRWEGTDAAGRPVASGVYFYRLRAGKEVVSKKMILLR